MALAPRVLPNAFAKTDSLNLRKLKIGSRTLPDSSDHRTRSSQVSAGCLPIVAIPADGTDRPRYLYVWLKRGLAHRANRAFLAQRVMVGMRTWVARMDCAAFVARRVMHHETVIVQRPHDGRSCGVVCICCARDYPSQIHSV